MTHRRSAKTLQRLALAAALLWPLAAQAEKADRDKKIVVEALEFERDQKNGFASFSGEVKVVQGTLEVSGDHATVQEDAEGNQTIVMRGRPVRFKQKLDGDAGMLNGRADRVDYFSKTGEAKFAGNAWIKTDSDEINGDLLTYNTQTEIYRAVGMSKVNQTRQKVRMEITPKPRPAEGAVKP
ncbi:lipopolysaccharide transport periplasmic protein LptA [Chitinimonas lacunae]|uniref:Lipopolysaccharide export system protein LptA n=1 Tax=Chitinimonas lacunae TaxID=1963018 RepID=A0ABV8MSD2_9NEIS